ncbi:MAG: hypothetical protein IT342_04505 [Candidatus Melainabacteria bacterium]|nr:hypothetical protein [Candidatus Melainabacteria bacterium]
MAIEQVIVAESTAQGGFLQSLNFLNIRDTTESSAKSSVSTARLDGASTARRPDSQITDEVIDCSIPIFPAEKAGKAAAPDANAAAGARAELLAKHKNKYEAAITEQVASLDSEAEFSVYTRDALNRDAERFPPTRNDKAGTTTYTIEQFGLSDRDLAKGDNTAAPYKRLVTITVPDAAASLKDCKFEYQDRQRIDAQEFNALVAGAQRRQMEQAATADAEHRVPRAEDMAFFTHGIRTAGVSSDFYSLALQLTNGHSVINVDWQSTPPSEQKVGLAEAYKLECQGAAQSYPKFEKALDDAVRLVGSDRTIMIAFSHGAMFDTRYLQHRKDAGSPVVGQVIFSHPDVKVSTLPQPDKDGKIDEGNRFFSCVAKKTHVIGSPSDWALLGAAVNDCEPSKSEDPVERARHHSRQMEIHSRLGSGAPICRNLVAGSGGTYVMETIPKDKRDFTKHFINMSGITGLINGERTLKVANQGASAEK